MFGPVWITSHHIFPASALLAWCNLWMLTSWNVTKSKSSGEWDWLSPRFCFLVDKMCLGSLHHCACNLDGFLLLISGEVISWLLVDLFHFYV